MGGGMGSAGPGCGSDYFLQELVNDNGVQYYHVIIGDPTVDDFAMEFYIRAASCCWWGGGGMGGGGMGGGGTPKSSSFGDTNRRLYNAWQPLEGGSALTGNGTANPNRVYLRQINNDGEMQQEFIKGRESKKPHIVQVIGDGELVSTFDLDMSNGGYNTFSDPVRFINNTTIVDVGSFDPNIDAPRNVDTPNANINVTAGRYTYLPDNPAGVSFGDSYGSYLYEEGGYDVFGTSWLDYCQPSQNLDRQCNFNAAGGGMGGGMGGR